MAKLTNTSHAAAVSFGQAGCAFSDTANNTIKPPVGKVIAAIQFLADTSLSALVAEDQTNFFNTAASAHSLGSYTRVVDGTVSSAAKAAFDDLNTAQDVQIGDFLVTVSTGASVSNGDVIALDPDGDNANEVQFSGNISLTDGDTAVFRRGGRHSQEGGNGTGGQTLATAQVFPKGLTIYGRWTEVSLNADDADGGIIAYFA